MPYALLNPDGSIKRVLLNVPPRLKLLPGERVVPYVPQETAEQLRDRLSTAIQARLDAFARTRGYDGILSACSYVASSVPQFVAEARRCVEMRDLTWASSYAILAEVQAGTRPAPTGLADIEADLPQLTWSN